MSRCCSEFIKGNPEPHKQLFSQSDDATLGNPFGAVGHGWEEVEATPMPALELDAFFETLCGILREADPAGTPIPHLMTGSTDARNFARLGIRTYGFLPHNFAEGVPYERAMHDADERVPMNALEFGTAAMHQAIDRYRG